MAEPSRTLCVVPARGGSKRVPRKNVRLLGGVPMLARTLRAVVASGVADRIVVSTDDDEIAAIALAEGADVPFRRPAELADDHTATAPVVAHAVGELALAGDVYDAVLVVYPTAVFTEPGDLQTAKRMLAASEASLVMTVCRYGTPIERAWRMGDDGRGRMVQPEHALTRTQDLPPSFHDAGQFYIGTTEFWTGSGLVAPAHPVLIELAPWRAVDIDTEDDLALAERLLRD